MNDDMTSQAYIHIGMKHGTVSPSDVRLRRSATRDAVARRSSVVNSMTGPAGMIGGIALGIGIWSMVLALMV